MATLKKSKTKLKKAQDGTSTDPRVRQGNAPASPSKPVSSTSINTGGRTALATPTVSERATAPKQSFSQAFAAGRAAADKGGSKTFTWNGKSYSTARADDKKSAATPPTPYSTSAQAAKDTAAKKASTSVGSPAFTANFPNQFSSVVAKAKATPASAKKTTSSNNPPERGSSYNPPEKFSKYFPKKSGVAGMKKGGTIKAKCGKTISKKK